MRRRALLALLLGAAVAVVPATLAGAASSAVKITVKPKVGSKHSRFTVGFKAPASTDSTSTTRRYEISASTGTGGGNGTSPAAGTNTTWTTTGTTTTTTGTTPATTTPATTTSTIPNPPPPAGAASDPGCVSSVARTISSATAGRTAQVTFGPGSGKSWCAGTWRGQVKETITPKCSPGMACPQYIALISLGTFSFRVR